MIPRQFGHYQLMSLLGVGGMGEVYRALDTLRDRDVALKLLPEVFSGDEEFMQRFRRESHVAARLREPHVIPIHDYGEINGRLFIDMRLVDGSEVGTILDRTGPMAPARAVHLVSQVADALDAAHADGLVHRDIKPSNILVTGSDFVYVVDFGIARAIGTARTSLTITGATVGTLDYMAPERFANLELDCRADVYSLACVLHECLTATRPFAGGDLPALMYAHLYSDPPRPSSMVDGVPPALDEVIVMGMAKRAEDRFASAGALAAAAREAIAGQPAPPTAHVATAAPATGERPGSPRAWSGAPQGDETVRVAAPRPGEPVAPYGMPAGSVGLTSANGLHHSVNRLPDPIPPRIAAAAGPTAAAPATPATADPPPPDRPRGRRRAPVIAGIAAVVAVALVVLAVTFLRPAATPDTVASGSAPSAEPTAVPAPKSPEPIPVAASIAVPAVGATIPVGATPGFVQVAPNGRFAYICNREAGVVTVLDTTINQVTATIPIAEGPPRFVAFSPDGAQAYVSIYNEERTINLVAFLDTATNTVTRMIPLGKRPFASATSPDGRLLYVPSHDEGRVEVVDTATAALVAEIPVAANPHWVAFGRDGRFVYTANHESGLLTVLDAATNGIVAEIPVGVSPHSTAVSPDGTRVSVVNYDSDEVSVIDTATNTVVATVPVGQSPQDIEYAPDGRFFYTANIEDDTVSVVSTETNRETARIPLPGGPTSISALPNGRQAYVTNLETGTVRILDIAAS